MDIHPEIFTDMPNSALISEQIMQSATEMLDESILSIEESQRGWNSTSFIAQTASKKCFIKSFRDLKDDSRNRCLNEWRALKFLSTCSVESVPMPIAYDDKKNLMVMEWIEGMRLNANSITAQHIHDAVRFLKNLQNCQKQAKTQSIPLASEACFSFEDWNLLFDQRLKSLAMAQHSMIESWIEDVFTPYVRGFIDSQSNVIKSIFIDTEQRVLSPSDVGFHNIICGPDNRLNFIDFEYFGWDDPTKMICDFVWEPGIPLGQSQKDIALEQLLKTSAWKVDPVWFEFVYPIVGLKWCVIMLNAFLPERVEGYAETDLLNQFLKAKSQLELVQRCLDNNEHRQWTRTK